MKIQLKNRSTLSDALTGVKTRHSGRAAEGKPNYAF
jgi:hypothetical protein